MSKLVWDRLLSSKKFQIQHGEITEYTSGVAADPSRSPYQQDHDRIIFSRPFRRLGRKTQVHPLALNDHTHNRLTHSVEVASVGRSIAQRIAEDLFQQERITEQQKQDIPRIVQVACLAHDMGNPPFGHTGENALRAWFKHECNAQAYLSGLSEEEIRDLQTYEGNAHTLRIICNTEMYKGQGGMRLTSASIGAMLKYPWTSSSAKGSHKFNIYQSELPYFKVIASELGLIEASPNEWCRHPLSYLMEAADDICYSILDLEDAVEMKIISIDEFKSLFQQHDFLEEPGLSDNHTCSRIRSQFIGRCIQHVHEQFMANYSAIMNGEFTQKDFFKGSTSAIAVTLEQLKQFASQQIYSHPSKLRREISAYPCLHHLLSLLIPAVREAHEQSNNPKTISERNKLILKLLDNQPATHGRLYESYMEVLDFIGGMTDNYALNLATETHGFKSV